MQISVVLGFGVLHLFSFPFDLNHVCPGTKRRRTRWNNPWSRDANWDTYLTYLTFLPSWSQLELRYT